MRQSLAEVTNQLFLVSSSLFHLFLLHCLVKNLKNVSCFDERTYLTFQTEFLPALHFVDFSLALLEFLNLPFSDFAAVPDNLKLFFVYQFSLDNLSTDDHRFFFCPKNRFDFSSAQINQNKLERHTR